MKKLILIVVVIMTNVFYITAQDSLYINSSDGTVISYAIFDVDSITFKRSNSIETNTVTDIDGNVYQTITIGTQTWMVENLKVTKYNDGTAIPNVTDDAAWAALTTGAYCYYDNDAANGAKYGGLYNWYAVNTGKLAPAGWHVPTDAEWTTLENYLIANGYNYDATTTDNKIAKALAAKTDWKKSTDTGAIGNDLTLNNSTGFSALPGGGRDLSGAFSAVGNYGAWWSATEIVAASAWARFMGGSKCSVLRGGFNKEVGFSVRCVRD